MRFLAVLNKNNRHEFPDCLPQDAVESGKNMPEWLVRAKCVLRAQFSEQVSLSVIAAEVGVHRVHLAREFRKYHGLTVGEYLRRVRIAFACRQLLTTHDPTATIASAAGFADQSHFIRVFKRVHRTTPGRFRAAHTGGSSRG